MSSIFQQMAFATPLALWGLALLPVIWWLLRATPPRPRQQAFPPIRILLGLPQQEETPDKTPWWLLLLRLTLAGLLCIAVAHPFLQPVSGKRLPPGERLVIIDNGWAAAKDWTKNQNLLLEVLRRAQEDGAPVTARLANQLSGNCARQSPPAAAHQPAN
jgi:Aerotolerance regulator N-terminal